MRKASRHLGASRRELFEPIDRPRFNRCRPGPMVCRVEELPGRHRLPRRDRRPLLLGPAPADPPGDRAPHDRQDRRAVPSGRRVAAPRRVYEHGATRRSPSTCQARHRRHADWTPRTNAARGRRHRPRDRSWSSHPREEAPSRAGLPLLPRHPAAARGLRCRTARGRLPRALPISGLSYSSVASILQNRLDRFRPAPNAGGAARRRPSPTTTSAARDSSIEEIPCSPTRP